MSISGLEDIRITPNPSVDTAEDEAMFPVACLLAETIVRRPLCPTLVHDPLNRLVICVAGLALCAWALWRVMRHFNS